jgi:hypothetical protein
MRLLTLALALTSLLAACGGSEPRATGDTAPAAPAASQPEPAPAGGEHPQLSPELDAFHDALAPRWHAEPGPARTRDTCAAVPEFRTRASAVKGAGAPAGAASTAWSEAGARLEKAVADLDAACRAPDAPGFDAAFAAVHDAFHHAMELAGGHGEAKDHGEHHGHGDPHR